METPAVSIIIPVYNSEKYLGEALDSLRSQTFMTYEVIAVDNNSADQSQAIITRYAEEDSRIKYVKCYSSVSSEQVGVSTARNTGIDIAGGEYIFFMDSDDQMPEYALGRLVALMQDSRNDIGVGGILHYKDGKGKIDFPPCNGTGSIYEGREKYRLAAELYEKRVFEFIFKLFRREFLVRHNIRFDESLSLGEDRLFMLEAFDKANRVCVIQDIIYLHRIRPNSLGYRYRSNMSELSLMLQNNTREWFIRNEVYDQEVQRICDGQFITGVGVMLLHTIHKEYRKKNRLTLNCFKEAKSIMELAEVRDLCSRKQRNLPLYKKVAWFFMKYKWCTPFIVHWKMFSAKRID